MEGETLSRTKLVSHMQPFILHEASVWPYPWCIPVLSIPTNPALPIGLTQSIPDRVALSVL